MNSNPVILASVILVSLTATFLFVGRGWRFLIGALGIQYIGVFLLTYASWPLEMAIVKMVAGWMGTAILAIGIFGLPEATRNFDPVKFGAFFRIMAELIISLAITSVVIHSGSWLSHISSPIRWGSLFLIAMGILQLGLTSHPLRVVIGLLTALSGFEIIYASVESSTLVTGLLAGVNLGLALIGTYMLLAPAMESST